MDTAGKHTVWKMPSTENHLFCHSVDVKEIDYTKLNQVNLGAGGRGEHGMDS